MRRARPAGLLAGGNAAANPLLRLLSGAGAFGPVASLSLRVASRISNALGSGVPVSAAGEFESCRLILICMPGGDLDAGVKWLAEARLDWHRRTVLIVDGDSSAPLCPLAKRGAATGVISAMPGFPERWFLLESTRAAAGEIRPLLAPIAARYTLIPPGTKPLFDAALTLSETGVFAMLAGADAALRGTELPRAIADRVLEKAVERAVRSWMKARARGWSGYADAMEEERLRLRVEFLERADARTAALLRHMARAARDYMA